MASATHPATASQRLGQLRPEVGQIRSSGPPGSRSGPR